MKKANLPEPEFEILRGTFRKEKNHNVFDENGQKSGQKTEQNNVEKSLNKTQIKILKTLKNNPKITQEMLSKELKLGRTAITSNIKTLKEKALIERIGSDRKGYWKILE